MKGNRGSLRAIASTAAIAALVAGSRDFVVFADATIESLRNRQTELLEQQQQIMAAADADRRELTVEEGKQIDELAAEFDRHDGEIKRRERLTNQSARLSTPAPRIAAAEPIPGDDDVLDDVDMNPVRLSQARAAARNPGARPALSAAREMPRRQMGNGGFRSFGDFSLAVVRGSMKGGEIDPRLMIGIRNAAATSISQEAVGGDGGFAVPPDFLNEINQTILAQDSLFALTDPLVSTKNAITVPMDETTQWGTGGIKAYWEGEAAAITQSKVALKSATVRLNKLAALVPVTEELLEDAPAIDSYLRQKCPEAIDWSLSYGLAWGTGLGMPLGFMNSPALVTQAAEGGQTADTINALNVTKMLSRLSTRSRKTAVWLIHPDAEPQLPQMSIGNQPVYLPPGGLADAPLGRLLGRPVIPHQICETVGDVGDLMLVDFNQYLTAYKTGGVKLAISMHLWFDQDISAFKFTMRVAGQPWWSAPMAPRDGANTQSPFVTLAAR